MLALFLAQPGRWAGVARADDPLDLIPAEAQLCWLSQPAPTGTQPPAVAKLAAWLDLGSRLVGKPLQGSALLWLRSFEAFGEVIKYPHALALIDAQAKPVGEGGSKRVDKMQVALVIDAGEDRAFVPRMIQRIINEQADTDSAVLTSRQAGPWKYQVLHDKRMEDWAVVAWGDMGRYTVVTLGEGVWEQVAKLAGGEGKPLSKDAWLAGHRKRGAETTRGGGGSGTAGATTAPRSAGGCVEVILNARGICERLDPVVANRATDFFAAWDANDVDRAHWTIGFEGRALYCRARFLRDGRDIERVFADPSVQPSPLRDAIPDTADYAIFHVPARKFIPQLLNSLVATRGELLRDEVVRRWGEIEKKLEFSGQRDVLDHLGDYVALHNDPPHPLGLPFMVTMVVEIKEEPTKVRETVDKMCRGWQAALEKANIDRPVPNPLVVTRDPDGVWYMQIGLAGPAWTVTDRFLIASWSPTALRMYMEHAGERLGRRIAAGGP